MAGPSCTNGVDEVCTYTFFVHNNARTVGELTITCITKYGSTLYIGMNEVLGHCACTFKNSDLHFHFQ